jgi:hypothetical protein
MWLALFGVVVGYGLVVGVSVVVSGRPGASAVDSGGPVTTGLSWLVWTLGTVSLVLDVELVVYVDDVADDGANSTGSGGLDELLAVWITAHTSNANSTSPATPAATMTGCWSCQLGSSSSPLTAGMLGPASQHLPGTPRKRALQEGAEADPADTERTERRRVVLVGQRDRVDRQR